MKHPFYTLYYTGLAVLISLLLFGGLFISNLSNIVDLIPKENKPKVQSNVVINPMVLETSTPKPVIEVKVSKIERKIEPKVESPKPKVVNDSLPKSTTQDTVHKTVQIKEETNDSTKTP